MTLPIASELVETLRWLSTLEAPVSIPEAMRQLGVRRYVLMERYVRLQEAGLAKYETTRGGGRRVTRMVLTKAGRAAVDNGVGK